MMTGMKVLGLVVKMTAGAYVVGKGQQVIGEAGDTAAEMWRNRKAVKTEAEQQLEEEDEEEAEAV